jgi:hypothetical protein
MKHLYKLVVILLLTTPITSFAEDDNNCEPKKTHSTMKGMMGMSAEQKKQHLRSMQAHMLLMHDYSNKILAEKDPIKAQKLKDQQLELMQAHMKKMMAHKKKMMEKHHKMMKKERED